MVEKTRSEQQTKSRQNAKESCFGLNVISNYVHSVGCSFISTGWASEALVLPIKDHGDTALHVTASSLPLRGQEQAQSSYPGRV